MDEYQGDAQHQDEEARRAETEERKHEEEASENSSLVYHLDHD